MNKHSPTQQIGIKAEKLAYLFLKKQGLKLVTRNFSSYGGEIDLIMEDHNTLIFVEVRYRSGQLTSGLETIDEFKQRRIILAATYYLQTHPTWKASRFDVISLKPHCVDVEINWIKDAFQVE